MRCHQGHGWTMDAGVSFTSPSFSFSSLILFLVYCSFSPPCMGWGRVSQRWSPTMGARVGNDVQHFFFLLLHVVLPRISLSTYNASLSIFYFCFLPLCLNTLIKPQTYHILMSHPIHRIPLWLRWMASFYPPPFRYVLLGYVAGY